MGLESFSQQLKRGFEELDPVMNHELASAAIGEPALAGLSVAVLRSRLRDPELRFPNQDRLWAAILRCYRRRPRIWGPLILELLAPALVGIAIRFVPHPPAIDVEDLQQQIVLQALEAARTIPLEGGRFVKPWLVLEVSRRIQRWLVREAGRSDAIAIEQEASQVADADDEAWELTEILASHPRHDDLELLYRLEVLGETLEKVARDLGCTANAVECWRRRARARLQRQLAA